jgi:hypothetical protein
MHCYPHNEQYGRRIFFSNVLISDIKNRCKTLLQQSPKLNRLSKIYISVSGGSALWLTL